MVKWGSSQSLPLGLYQVLVTSSRIWSHDVILSSLATVPSIVVDNNGSGSGMERQRPMKSRLSKQEEFEEVDEEDVTAMDQMMVVVGVSSGIDGGGSGCNDNKKTHYEKMDNRLTKSLSTEGSPTSNKDRNENSSSVPRQRSHPKVKLLQRSHALRDDTSPPPDTESLSTNTLSVTAVSTHTSQTKTSSGKHHRLGKQGSSQGSLEGSSPALSRDSSLEQYTDSTGTDLQQFIIDTLHKNQKDRMLLLKIEQELINLVKDNKRQHFKFSQMSAYQRMLVHRVAAFFGLDHNVDQAGTSVIVNKTKNTRIPDMKFREQIKDELIPDEPKKSILKRDSSSFEEGKDLKSPERQLSSESRRSKSFEEREEEYGKARARIFNQDSSSSQEGAVDSPLSRRSSQEDLRWPSEPRPWSSTDSDSSNRPTKLVITKTSASTESEPSSSDRLSGGYSSRNMSKSDSSDGTSKDALCPRRSTMPKASSFGGISVLVRTDSSASAKSASPRLTKAESFSSGGVSGSGGSFTQTGDGSNRNTSVTARLQVTNCTVTDTILTTTPTATMTPANTTAIVTTPTTTISMASSATSPISLDTPVSRSVSHHSMAGYQTLLNSAASPQQCQPVMWAVSNMESVPPGSILINPQTGSPYMNTDGTVYRHNPANTLPLQSFLSSAGGLMQHQQQMTVAPPPPPPQRPSQQPPGLILSLPPQQPSQSPQPLTLPTPPISSQHPFILCAPNTQTTPVGDQQRHFLMDAGGGNTLVELSSQLSNLSFTVAAAATTTPLATADNLMGNETPMQTNVPSPHAYSMPVMVSGTSRPNNMIIPQQQQQQQQQQQPPPPQQQNASVVQMPLYLLSNSLRYVNPSPYTTTVAASATTAPPQPLQPQVLPHLNQPTQLLDGHQQQQLQDSPVVLTQTSQNPPQGHDSHSVMLAQQTQHQQLQHHQIQGTHCVPLPGYGQLTNSDTYNVSPYFTMAPPTHLPVSSGGVTCPTLAYTVTSLNLPGSGNGTNGGGGGVGVAQGLNPSHTTFTSGATVSGPMCGMVPTSAGNNRVPTVAAPPPLHSSAYQHVQTVFRPQTPPIQLQGSHSFGLPIGQQQQQQQQQQHHHHHHHHHHQQQQQNHQQTMPVSIGGRSFVLATAGVAAPTICPSYSLQSSSQMGNPGSQSQIQVAQQCTPMAPTSQTPPLFNTYAQHVLTSLPLFRPNVRMMVRSNTTPPPPSQNVMQQSPGNGQYATAPLMTKGYGIPMVDQRFIKTNDLYLLDATVGNINDGKGVLAPSLPTLQNNTTGLRPPSVPLYSRGIPLVQGDMRLIGTPLQHQLQPQLRIPMVLSQQRSMPRLQSPQQSCNAGAGGGGRAPKMRRQRSKGSGGGSSHVGKMDGVVLSAMSSSLETERGNHILQVQGFPDGLRKSDAERYLEEVVHHGAKLQFVRNTTTDTTPTTDFLVTNKVHVYAVFDSETAAQSALLNIKTTKFQLRIPGASKQLADRQQAVS